MKQSAQRGPATLPEGQPPWFGRLPPEWRSAPLRYLVTFSGGGTPDKGKPEYWNGTIPWVSPKDMKRDAIGDSEDHITEAALDGTVVQLLPPQSVLVVVRGMILARTLPVAVTTKAVTINQDIKALRCGPSLLPRFLQAVLQGQSHWLLSQADQSAHGTKKVETDVLRQFETPCPSLTTQQQVVGYLESESGHFDALIAAKEHLLDLLAEKRGAIVASAVICGSDPAVPLRDSGVPWLGQIPAHWPTRRIAWLFRERDERDEPELPLLEVSIKEGVVEREFSADRIESTAADFNSYKVARAGDVVFNKMRMWQGAVGVAPVDGLVSPDYVVASPNGALAASYARFLFRLGAFSLECCRRSHGIVWDRLRLYWEGFREIEVPLPPLHEQVEIVADIATRTSRLDRLRVVTERSLDLLRERRAALIAAAVTGQFEAAGNGN